MFRYRVIGGVEVRRPEALRASVSRTTIFIMPTRASVCSTGGRLQMVKISKRSVGKLKSYEHKKIFPLGPLGHSSRPGLKLARVTFTDGLETRCQKLAPDQSFIVRHCVKFSVPRVPSNSPWKGFRHNFHALIWATCSRRNFEQMTERCSWALLITLQ